MPNRKLLHSRSARSTSGAAPHAIRARRCALLHLQVREFSDEASISAMPRFKPLNLFLTLLPVHSVVLDMLPVDPVVAVAFFRRARFGFPHQAFVGSGRWGLCPLTSLFTARRTCSRSR